MAFPCDHLNTLEGLYLTLGGVVAQSANDAMGQSLPSYSAPVPANGCFAPKATIQGMGPNRREVPIGDIQDLRPVNTFRFVCDTRSHRAMRKLRRVRVQVIRSPAPRSGPGSKIDKLVDLAYLVLDQPVG